MENERAPQAVRTKAYTSAMRLEPLILASSSPRRAGILRAVGWPFEVLAPTVDESIKPRESAREYVQRLGRTKAEAAIALAPHLTELVLGADTVVTVEGEVFGKPRDADDARRMLKRLNNRWHEVLTGVALVRAVDKRCAVAYEQTRVRFAAMSDAEIDWYVGTGEPADKAGAYAVQGQAALFIKNIEGDYWNVVGLPVRLVYELARDFWTNAKEEKGRF